MYLVILQEQGSFLHPLSKITPIHEQGIHSDGLQAVILRCY